MRKHYETKSGREFKVWFVSLRGHIEKSTPSDRRRDENY